MKIHWPCVCFVCQIPLDVDFQYTHDDEEKLLDEFLEFFPTPPNFHYNVSAKRRFNDGKFHPLCAWCFDNHRKIWINPSMVRDREIGKIKFAHPSPKGTTRAELETYLTNMKAYFAARRRHGDVYF